MSFVLFAFSFKLKIENELIRRIPYQPHQYC
jgi:hypothetical protein